MLTQRQLFLHHVAQTSPSPLALEIEKAEGIYLFDKNEKTYIDLISGIAVSNLGHCHPKVVQAIKEQAEKYMHLMVYGEYIHSPQVEYATLLCSLLPASLDSCYLVNSGTEATEGALKLAKRYTGRSEIIAFKNAYHGSTQGSLSVMGNEFFKQSFRPLLPDIRFIEFNNIDHLELITEKTACVIAETVQGEAGVRVPDINYMKQLRDICSKNGTLLILDEIQTGFGRTGKLFGFEHYNITSDILTIGKGMGGGLPAGAFISSQEIMSSLTHDPVLGHITTFGGNPVICSAALATLKELLSSGLIKDVEAKASLFREHLKHPLIKELRGAGLLMAVEMQSKEINFKVIERCIKNGVITDWFLFNDYSMRLAPPLIITKEEIIKSCELILKSMDEVEHQL